MKFISNLVSIMFKKRFDNIQTSKKTFDEIYKDVGVFIYEEGGFKIIDDSFSKSIKWNEIEKINTYKKDLITTYLIVMEIIYGDNILTINEELSGWFQFVLKSKKHLPNLIQDWDLKIIHPAFETNFTTIYTKE